MRVSTARPGLNQESVFEIGQVEIGQVEVSVFCLTVSRCNVAHLFESNVVTLWCSRYIEPIRKNF